MIELFGLLQVGHNKSDHFLIPVVVKMSDRAEVHRYPVRVMQSKLDGWCFIFVDEVPGLGVVGPNFEDLLGRIKVLAGNLFRARGEPVDEIEIVRSENPALHVFY
jgi:hypothetical protein